MICADNRLHYDPETGVFTWLETNTNRVAVGDEAGTVDRQGYRRIMLDGKKIAASRLAWDVMHPSDLLNNQEQVDHINHNRDDNRACNLRKTDHIGNCRNRTLRSDNKYGLSGLGWRSKEKKWIVQVGPKGEAYRGLFADLLSAASEVFRGRAELEFHKNHGDKKNA